VEVLPKILSLGGAGLTLFAIFSIKNNSPKKAALKIDFVNKKCFICKYKTKNSKINQMKTLSKSMIRRIDHLREEMLNNDAFEETFQHFFDIALEDTFIQSGKEVTPIPLITSAITKTLQRLYEKAFPERKINQGGIKQDTNALISINQIKKQGLCHGPVLMFGGIGGFFYFESEGVGLLSISFPGNGEVWYARFSTLQDLDGYLTPINPPDPTVLH
jgi:hypothetical protein